MQQPHSMQSTRRSYCSPSAVSFSYPRFASFNLATWLKCASSRRSIKSAHVDHQVADHREVAQRLDPQGSAVVRHRADGGDAGQLFHAVDAHAAGAAGGVVAGVPEGQAAVVKSPDTLDAIQDVFIRVDLQLKRLGGCFAVAFLAGNDKGYFPFFCSLVSSFVLRSRLAPVKKDRIPVGGPARLLWWCRGP